MSHGELPEGFFGWVLTGVVAVIGALATGVATLWKVSESKNSKAIDEQRMQVTEVKTEVKLVRESLKTAEEARLECERDRAALTAKCEIFESRLSRLESKA